MVEELKPCPCWQRDHNPCTCWQKNHRDGCPAQADKDTVTLKRSEVDKFTRRSSYAWSDGGEYTPNDWKNECAIYCAKLILENALGKVE